MTGCMALHTNFRCHFVLGGVVPCGAFVGPPYPPRPFHPRRGERGAKADSQFGFFASAAALQAQCSRRLRASPVEHVAHVAPIATATPIDRAALLPLPALRTVGKKPAPTKAGATSCPYFRSRREANKLAVRFGHPLPRRGVRGGGDGGVKTSPVPQSKPHIHSGK